MSPTFSNRSEEGKIFCKVVAPYCTVSEVGWKSGEPILEYYRTWTGRALPIYNSTGLGCFSFIWNQMQRILTLHMLTLHILTLHIFDYASPQVLPELRNGMAWLSFLQEMLLLWLETLCREDGQAPGNSTGWLWLRPSEWTRLLPVAGVWDLADGGGGTDVPTAQLWPCEKDPACRQPPRHRHVCP